MTTSPSAQVLKQMFDENKAYFQQNALNQAATNTTQAQQSLLGSQGANNYQPYIFQDPSWGVVPIVSTAGTGFVGGPPTGDVVIEGAIAIIKVMVASHGNCSVTRIQSPAGIMVKRNAMAFFVSREAIVKGTWMTEVVAHIEWLVKERGSNIPQIGCSGKGSAVTGTAPPSGGPQPPAPGPNPAVNPAALSSEAENEPAQDMGCSDRIEEIWRAVRDVARGQ